MFYTQILLRNLVGIISYVSFVLSFFKHSEILEVINSLAMLSQEEPRMRAFFRRNLLFCTVQVGTYAAISLVLIYFSLFVPFNKEFHAKEALMNYFDITTILYFDVLFTSLVLFLKKLFLTIRVHLHSTRLHLLMDLVSRYARLCDAVEALCQAFSGILVCSMAFKFIFLTLYLHYGVARGMDYLFVINMSGVDGIVLCTALLSSVPLFHLLWSCTCACDKVSCFEVCLLNSE